MTKKVKVVYGNGISEMGEWRIGDIAWAITHDKQIINGDIVALYPDEPEPCVTIRCSLYGDGNRSVIATSLIETSTLAKMKKLQGVKNSV